MSDWVGVLLVAVLCIATCDSCESARDNATGFWRSFACERTPGGNDDE